MGAAHTGHVHEVCADIIWLDAHGGGVSGAPGTLAVVMKGDRIGEIVVETGGGAVFIPRASIISIEPA